MKSYPQSNPHSLSVTFLFTPTNLNFRGNRWLTSTEKCRRNSSIFFLSDVTPEKSMFFDMTQ